VGRQLDAILKLEVPIIVLIGERRLPLSHLLSLRPGSILELPKSAEDELELLVNNKPIGTGIAVKLGENFGLKTSFVGNLRQRIEALAGERVSTQTQRKAAPQPADEAVEDTDAESEDAAKETEAAAPAAGAESADE